MQMPEGREFDVEELMARVREEVARRRQHPTSMSGSSQTLSAERSVPEPVLASAVLPSNNRRRHLKEFLDFHDREFIVHAYTGVLGRNPDAGGLHHYLELLRRGTAKAEILGRLRFSREGRRNRVRIRGLLLPLAFHAAYRVPVIGYAVRLPVALLRLPKILRNMMQFEHHAMARLIELTEKVVTLETRQAEGLSGQAEELRGVRAALEDRAGVLQGGLEEVTGQLTALESRQNEALSGQAEELSGVRKAMEDRAGALQGRLEEVIGQLTALESRHGETHSAHAEALSDQAQELRGVRAALTEFDATVEKAAGEARGLMQRIEELQSSKVDGTAVTAMSNRVEHAFSNLDRLKRDVVLQDRRLGLLLEETRKRLPEEPLEAEQLAVFDQEARHRLDAMYVSFEDEFRGTREDIKGRVEVYLPIIRECGAGTPDRPVLDIGCGRGEWLEVLAANRLTARGIDINRIMVDQCRGLGLEVTESDALGHLRSLPDGGMGAITGHHIIEHLPFDIVIALFDECLRVLVPGGVVIFETPNPANLLVGACNFYLDPTHRNPLPSQTVSFMAEARGFCRVKTLPLHPMAEFGRMNQDREGIEGKLTDLLFGPQDYAVIGYRP